VTTHRRERGARRDEDQRVDGGIVAAAFAFDPIHEAQLRSYLKLSGRHVGLLINFDVKLLENSVRMLVNELPE
jgi:hypothetical protein